MFVLFQMLPVLWMILCLLTFSCSQVRGHEGLKANKIYCIFCPHSLECTLVNLHSCFLLVAPVLTCEDVLKAAVRKLSTGGSPGSTDGLAASSSVAHQIVSWTWTRASSVLLPAPQPPLKLLSPVSWATQRLSEASRALPTGLVTLTHRPADIYISS